MAQEASLDGPGVVSPPQWRGGQGAALLGVVRGCWAGETERYALWLPVLFGLGIAGYFLLPQEPAWWLGPAAAIFGAAVGFVWRRTGDALIVALAIAAVGFGFTDAQRRTQSVAAPVLAQRVGPVEIAGRVAAVELRADDGRRVMLDRLAIPGLAAERTPRQVRIRLRAGVDLVPGERIAVRAVVLPPPGPAAPGAFDFQRQAWFEQLGGVGYATAAPRRLQPAEAERGWRLWLTELRQSVQARIMAAIPGPAGAVAAALVTGEMAAIPEDVSRWMRDSGLAHILSISGLHIGLVATIVLLAVRGGLALIPPLALRWPTKKIAAIAAWAAISFYTLFAAASPPTLRSWLMTSIVLFAIVVDRTAISMRLVAWAAFAILLFLPESMLGPSFQMSFAAVVALIAAYEGAADRFRAWRSGGGKLRRAASRLAAVCFTTLVAGTASAPFALYHFNRFAAFGLVANFLAIPLTGVWVMPCLVFGVLLMPLGLDSYAWTLMGWGVEGIIAIARMVAGWDGAVTLLPEMPAWGLAMVALGGLWICLWRRRWRWWGVPAVAMGLLSIALHRGPDVLVSGDARLVAVRGSDGLLQLSGGRAAKLTRETWLRRAGQEDAELWPESGASADNRLGCDQTGCIYRANGHMVALAKHASALAEDCRLASVVIAIVPVRRGCAAPVVTVDRFALWRDGGHAVWLDDDRRVRVESVRASQGQRPWVVPLPQPRERPPTAAARGDPE